MIVCHCTGATDRDVREGRAKLGRCGGCAPLVKKIRAALPQCLLCNQHTLIRCSFAGYPVCDPCWHSTLCPGHRHYLYGVSECGACAAGLARLHDAAYARDVNPR